MQLETEFDDFMIGNVKNEIQHVWECKKWSKQLGIHFVEEAFHFLWDFVGIFMKNKIFFLNFGFLESTFITKDSE